MWPRLTPSQAWALVPFSCLSLSSHAVRVYETCESPGMALVALAGEDYSLMGCGQWSTAYLPLSIFLQYRQRLLSFRQDWDLLKHGICRQKWILPNIAWESFWSALRLQRCVAAGGPRHTEVAAAAHEHGRLAGEGGQAFISLTQSRCSVNDQRWGKWVRTEMYEHHKFRPLFI